MNGRAWTADDTAQLRRLVASGMTDAAIGEAMGRHPKVIHAKRHELGIEAGISPAAKALLARLTLRRTQEAAGGAWWIVARRKRVV